MDALSPLDGGRALLVLSNLPPLLKNATLL